MIEKIVNWFKEPKRLREENIRLQNLLKARNQQLIIAASNYKNKCNEVNSLQNALGIKSVEIELLKQFKN
jgi:superfamily II DNA/RNA helicase